MSKFISCSAVGGYGRWGNNICQYMFARHYADLLGAELHIPATWYGWKVFDLDAKPMKVQAQRVNEMDLDYKTSGVDIWGYFQDPQFLSQLSREKCKQWLRPKIKRKGHKYVAHLRRGDYLTTPGYTVIPWSDLVRSFNAQGVDADEVAIYSDDPQYCRNGARPDPSNPWNDWLEIQASEVIWRSASSYSWTAALLSDAKHIFSPLTVGVEPGKPIEFQPDNDAQLHSLFGPMTTKP